MKAATIRRVFNKSKGQKPSARTARRGPSAAARREIRQKTGGKCHFCGGMLAGRWQADHVVPLARGGGNKASNYLPICTECNRLLRWSYRPAVLRLALRFGLLVKQEIRHRTPLGEVLVRLGSDGSKKGASRLAESVVKDAKLSAKRERRRRTRG